MSGPTVIAEATKATGEIMTKHMLDIAECSRELERSKIEVQLKLFSEQMLYQREKDRRLYENAVASNENAKLSIIKQGEMVNYLAQLSGILNRSLNTSIADPVPGTPHSAAKDGRSCPPQHYMSTRPASPPENASREPDSMAYDAAAEDKQGH